MHNLSVHFFYINSQAHLLNGLLLWSFDFKVWLLTVACHWVSCFSLVIAYCPFSVFFCFLFFSMAIVCFGHENREMVEVLDKHLILGASFRFCACAVHYMFCCASRNSSCEYTNASKCPHSRWTSTKLFYYIKSNWDSNTCS